VGVVSTVVGHTQLDLSATLAKCVNPGSNRR
jgi:hypothetical protein